MTREQAIEHGKEQLEIFGGEHKEFIECAIDTMRKYQMIQADYNARLKADMVAMFTDIQLEFKEGLGCKGCCNNCVNACEDIPAGWFLDFIDAKINSLKGESEVEDGNNT
jgi:hypothetical protein